MNPLFKTFIFIVFTSWLFVSCDKEQEKIPSYLHISQFTFTSSSSVQGLGTSEIIGAKVFVNGKEMGNFEIPVTLPVLTEGRAYIEIYPNIKENGSYSKQKYFKPYTGYLDTLQLKAGRIDTVRPVSTYRSNTKFVWMEDFEDQAISMIRSGASNTDDSIICLSTTQTGVDQPFSGSKFCGYINLKQDTATIFERSSLFTYELPNLGTDVYVEMDIKTNSYFQVGIYSDDNVNLVQSPVMVVNPTDGAWKKIYVNLVNETGGLSTGTKVRIFFGMYKDQGVEAQYAMIDNIKLVYVE